MQPETALDALEATTQEIGTVMLRCLLRTQWDYLRARQEFLPNYRQRYIARQYIGSGHTEKFNDLLVARRQKGQGRHWSQETSDALVTLRTLLLNGGWDRYWQHRQAMPLPAS